MEVNARSLRWIRLSTRLGALTLSAAPLMPAAAQDVPATPSKIIEDCRGSSDEEEIVVCGSNDAVSSYRLPSQQGPFDPWGTVESVSRERNRLMEGGETGIHSCSTVGPGGWTGCDLKVIKRAEQQGKRVGIGSVGLQVGKHHLKAFDIPGQ